MGPSKVLEDYIAPAVEPALDTSRRRLAFDGVFSIDICFESNGGSEVSLLLHGLGVKVREAKRYCFRAVANNIWVMR